MGKVTERDIISFAIEFVNRVCRIDSDLICYGKDDYSMRWNNKEIMLYDIYKNKLTVDEVLEKSTLAEMNVGEFTDNNKCIAYLVCEGELYQQMYNCEGYGEGGEKAQKLLDAANNISKKYGMRFDWASGAMIFYDSFEEKVEFFVPTADNYISDNYSICREERQYALFLYNILRKYNSKIKRTEDEVLKIFEACSLPPEAEIKHVFYEATLMRDFFERNRRLVLCSDPDVNLLSRKFKPKAAGRFNSENSFNYKLLKYLKYIDKNDSYDFSDEFNLGGSGSTDNDTAREMMNATPDIAVIYSLRGDRYLHFLECKFESYEDTYKSKKGQCEIQWMIADFLCKNYLTSLMVSPQMDKDKKSCLVQFIRKEPKKPNEIPIEVLIGLNNEILKGGAIMTLLNDIRLDAVKKSHGAEQGEKIFELIHFMCKLNELARNEGLLAVSEAEISSELALNEEIREARELFVGTASAEELTRLLANLYEEKKFQGENALLYFIIILSFVNLGRKSPDEFEKLLNAEIPTSDSML